MRSVLAVCIILFLPVASFAARPDLNAFLNRRALSISQLRAQVKADSEVRERYRRHFAMADKDLFALLGSLRMSSLTESKTLQVYSVPPDGRIRMHAEVFPVGTPVYVDIAGSPILIVKCGNPLSLGPGDKLAENDVERSLGEPVAELKALAEPLPVSTDLTNPRLLAFTPDVSSVPEVQSRGSSPIQISAAAFPFGSLLFGSLGLGTLLIVDDESDTTPVPEPASLAAIAIGAVALMRRKKRS